MPHKIITYHHIENILKNSFKEAVRYDSPYSEDGNLTFLQNIIEKRLHQLAHVKKIALSGKNKTPFSITIQKSYHGKI